MSEYEKIHSYIEKNRSEMIRLQKLLTAVPAISPDSGGEGEEKKAEVLIRFLKTAGIEDIEVYNAPDERVPSGNRPNVVATIPGNKDDRRFWIMSHLDIVPPGNSDLWENDPYEVVEKEGRLIGRGVEDNQQGLVSSVFAALSLHKNGIVPEYTVKLLFIADEEMGSQYGIKYLIENHDLFLAKDSVLVPDSGNEDGSLLEIAEKSVLWLEFTVIGRQCHASMPNQGINAFTAGSELVLLLEDMKNRFDRSNDLFTVPYSTFSPTRKSANVPNINTIPGEDIFCIDCRILPEIEVDEVLQEIDERIRKVEEKRGVSISYEIKQRMSSKPTSKESLIVTRLSDLVRDLYKTEPKLVGIGGGTVAAYLRNNDIPTVVWARIAETAHSPNEYCIVDNLVGDAKIMARLMLGR